MMRSPRLLFAIAALPTALTAGTTNAEKADEAMKTLLTPVSITTRAFLKATAEADARLRAVEFFDVKLPTEKAQDQIHFSFEPKVGDLLRRDYVRYPVEVAYSPVRNLTDTFGITPLSPNPFRYQKNWGLGKLSNEVRYDWHPAHAFFEAYIFGTGVDVPLGKVPTDFINGFTHIKPFVAFSKNLHGQELRLILEASDDIATKWVHAADEALKFNVLQFGPVLAYKPGEFGYFAQYSVKHYSRSDESFTGHLARLGSLWDIPLVRSEKWGLPGKWEVSVALQSETDEFGRTNVGLNTRVRWKFDLKHRTP